MNMIWQLMVIQMTHNRHSDIYIASCSKKGGIYHYILAQDGSLELKESCKIDRPMYMTIANDKMYILLREPYENLDDSGLVICDIEKNETFAKLSEVVSTKGKCACHLAVCDGKAYVVNYLSGSVILMPDKIKVHSGNSVNKDRQESSHPHFVCETPDKKYMAVTDLGTDEVYFYTKDMEYFSKVSAPKGAGPRHIVFTDGYMYCANELHSSVSVYYYHDGKACLKKTYSTLPEDFKGESTVAAIRTDGNYLYVSNRGHNSIAEFEIFGDNLKLRRFIGVYGKSPRDFNVFGEYIISTNELSDNVTVISKQNGELINYIKLEHPLCVVKK